MHTLLLLEELVCTKMTKGGWYEAGRARSLHQILSNNCPIFKTDYVEVFVSVCGKGHGYGQGDFIEKKEL